MAELATEQRIAKEDYDWGHLRPNEFRMIFIPRHELREPGHADSESSDDARRPAREEAREDAAGGRSFPGAPPRADGAL